MKLIIEICNISLLWLVLSRLNDNSLGSKYTTQQLHHGHVNTPMGVWQDEAGCILFPHKDFPQKWAITLVESFLLNSRK